MVLESTQPLTEMSTRNISWVKGGWCVGLTILPASGADWIFLKSGSLNLLEPSGPVQAYNGMALPLPYQLLVVLSVVSFIEILQIT